MSVFSCCWNLIHMLMRWIPMDFSLLCRRYHLQHSMPPPLAFCQFLSLSRSLTFMLSLGHKLAHSNLLYGSMQFCLCQVVERFRQISIHLSVCLKCFFPVNRNPSDKHLALANLNFWLSYGKILHIKVENCLFCYFINKRTVTKIIPWPYTRTCEQNQSVFTGNKTWGMGKQWAQDTQYAYVCCKHFFSNCRGWI